MGTKLIKNLLYFHLKMYIEMWGPPKGWNALPNVSHHKTEVKHQQTILKKGQIQYCIKHQRDIIHYCIWPF